MLPVLDEQLAAHLGLDELRVGAGRTSAASGPQVLAWWSVSVEPSFARSWAVGAVYEEEWTGGPDPNRVSARGFMADASGAAVAPLGSDDVLDALGRLNPFQLVPTPRKKVVVLGPGRAAEMWVGIATLDGLGYAVRWGTQATGGGFRFSNPQANWLVEFERVLFRFARRVVTASGELRFDSQLRYWAERRDQITPAEPGAATDQGGM